MTSGEKKEWQSRSSHSFPPEPNVRETAATATMKQSTPIVNVLKPGKDRFNVPSRVVLQMLVIQVEQRNGSISFFPSGAMPGKQRGLPRDLRSCHLHLQHIAAHKIPAPEEEGPCGEIAVGGKAAEPVERCYFVFADILQKAENSSVPGVNAPRKRRQHQIQFQRVPGNI